MLDLHLLLSVGFSLGHVGSLVVALSCTVARGILVPQSQIEPIPPALEGKVLTPGLPGKSLVTVNLKLRFPRLAKALLG